MSDLPSNATVLFNVSINSVCAGGAGVCAVCVCMCTRTHAPILQFICGEI